MHDSKLARLFCHAGQTKLCLVVTVHDASPSHFNTDLVASNTNHDGAPTSTIYNSIVHVDPYTRGYCKSRAWLSYHWPANCDAFLKVVESSCFVRVNYLSETEDSFGLEEAINAEKDLAEYFDTFIDSRGKIDAFRAVKPYRFHFDVADHIATSTKSTITAIATLLYEYDEGETAPVVLENVLPEIELKSTFAFGTEVEFEFSPATSGTISQLDYRNPRGRSASEICLIFVTILLSVLLLMTSSVLLHITGGWLVFKNAVIHCLFEEIEIDESDDEMKRSPTYSRSDDEGDNEKDDEESNITSVPPSTASGMLGVRGGLLRSPTMSEGDESSMTYGDSSPTNHYAHASLGINPHSPRGTGVSGMLQRFGRTPAKKE